jgi:type VI secretion system secreted protein VgrG
MIATLIDAALQSPQQNRLLRLHFPHDDGPGATLLPNRLDAHEALSRDFCFQVEILSKDASIPLKEVLGKMVTVELVREDGSLRYFNGYVFKFLLAHTDGGMACYNMELRPWLAFLDLRRDNYLFHGKTVEEQTKLIFDDYPIHDWAYRVIGSDEPMTDACQFAESDQNYLQRRWEERGWFYTYEHRKDGHTLVLMDDSTQQTQGIDGPPTMRWQDKAGSLDDDGISRFVPIRTVASTLYAASSFDFKKPHPVTTNKPTLNQQGSIPALEVYEYAGAYGFKHLSDGDNFAKRQMESLEARGKHFEAESNERFAQPGRHFKLIEHFDFGEALGPEGDDEFLIIEVFHHIENNYVGVGDYRNKFYCLRKKIPWRPGHGYNSSEPKIYGLQTAIVVGPAGEEIHTDAYGRVRVQFHWDREGEYNEKSSAWVRVASTWAGSNFGFVAVPRIGQEVLVQFLDGNPDRPLITGRVYNQQNMPPWDLPANQTQTGILSRSSKGGGYDNANAIRFEDKKGSEEVWLHAEKDQRIEVEHNESHWVGNDRSKTIDHDETVLVKHDRTETVDNNETITVHNNRTERVDHNETISIGDNRSEDVGLNETISIGQNQSVTIGDNRSVTIGGNKSETIAQAKTESIGLAKALSIGLGYQTTVGGAMNTTVGLMQAEQVGLNKSVMVGNKFSITAGDELEITVGKSSLVMKSDGTVLINGTTFNFSASGPVAINGKDVDIN